MQFQTMARDPSVQVQDSLALLAQDDRRTLSSYCTALLTLLITAHGAALGSTNGSELQHARGKLRRDQEENPNGQPTKCLRRVCQLCHEESTEPKQVYSSS